MLRREALALFALLAALGCLTPAYADDQVPHECGRGPVSITISGVGSCPCEPPPPTLNPDGSYSAAGFFACPANACPFEYREWWSDWPECGGRPSVDAAPAVEP